MKNSINEIINDDILVDVNGGVAGIYPEPDVEEVKRTMKLVAASLSRETAIDIGMQLLGCTREEAERILDEE